MIQDPGFNFTGPRDVIAGVYEPCVKRAREITAYFGPRTVNHIDRLRTLNNHNDRALGYKIASLPLLREPGAVYQLKLVRTIPQRPPATESAESILR
jgi:hypothetical protein